MSGPRVDRVLVRGAELAVRDEGDGRPLFWLHGLTSDMESEDTDELISAPPADGLRVVRYDARSHGASEVTGGVDAHTWPELAADLLALADQVDVQEFIAAGWSMGAATALHAAVQAPERVRGLVLVAPPTGWEARDAQRGQYRRGLQVLSDGGLSAYADAMLARTQHPVAAETGGTWQRNRRERLLGGSPAGIERGLNGAIASDLPEPDVLRTIQVPALILTWPGDVTHPAETGRQLAQLLPAAEYEPAQTLAEVRTWPRRIAEWAVAL